MKINEVISEAGMWKSFGKGIAKAIAPQTVQTYDRQKNALRAPQTAGDPAMANVASTTSNVATTTSQVVTPSPAVDIPAPLARRSTTAHLARALRYVCCMRAHCHRLS